MVSLAPVLSGHFLSPVYSSYMAREGKAKVGTEFVFLSFPKKELILIKTLTKYLRDIFSIEY